MMQEKSSNDHDENKENLMKDLETTVEIKEKVIIFIYFFSFQATKAQYLISISIFSLAPALGTGIGTYLSERKNGRDVDEEEIENDLALQILQGKYIICRTQFWV